MLDGTIGGASAWVGAGLAPSRPSSNDLLLYDNTSTKWQRAEIIGVSGRVLQLNTTWTFGEDPPAVLEYAMSDYPAMLAEGESVIKYKSPLNVLTDTYDHSCY